MHKTLNLPRNVSKFYAGQVVSQNLLLNVDPLSAICNNKLIAQGEELETSAKVESFLSNISSLRLKWGYKRYVFLFLVFRRL